MGMPMLRTDWTAFPSPPTDLLIKARLSPLATCFIRSATISIMHDHPPKLLKSMVCLLQGKKTFIDGFIIPCHQREMEELPYPVLDLPWSRIVS
jgi:hypothetical protein